jgi:hypothetical protein
VKVASNVDVLTADNNDLLTFQQRLGNHGSETTQNVTLSVNNLGLVGEIHIEELPEIQKLIFENSETQN